jgi:hypothetical protein
MRTERDQEIGMHDSYILDPDEWIELIDLLRGNRRFPGNWDLPSWPKAQDLRSCLTEVRGFGYNNIAFRGFMEMPLLRPAFFSINNIRPWLTLSHP